MTSTASSTWHRPPQALQGDLVLGSAVIRAAHPALQMIPPSWPFVVWGLDILGPFPRVVGGYRYLYVAIDKFTKWPEVTPMLNITKASATTFLKSIVCRFGVPNWIIIDNGTQFTSQYF
jgi:hypothetical protein